MTLENQPWMKMYLPLKMVISHCHVSWYAMVMAVIGEVWVEDVFWDCSSMKPLVGLKWPLDESKGDCLGKNGGIWLLSVLDYPPFSILGSLKHHSGFHVMIVSHLWGTIVIAAHLSQSTKVVMRFFGMLFQKHWATGELFKPLWTRIRWLPSRE